jgi:hypothetical protein
MGYGDDVAKRRLEDTKHTQEEERERRLQEWADRAIAAYPGAMENLERLDYLLEMGAHAGDGQLIPWQGDKSYGWCLRHDEDADRVYLLADGTLLRARANTNTFDEVSLEEAARMGITVALENMAAFRGGRSRYKTRKLTWRQVLGW